MKISIIQMDIVEGSKEENIDKALSFIKKCKNSDFVVLPELWSTGLTFNHVPELAESINGETISLLGKVAAQEKTIIIGSILERENSSYYNTLHIMGPGGLLGIYRKIHLFSLMRENQVLEPGTHYSTFPVKSCIISGIICYDIRFPELSRALALKGTQILFVPAEFPHPRKNHWQVLLRARAIENQFFVVACNRTGQSEKYHFFGASTVIDPWGDVLVEAADQEGIITYRINMERISECRRELPALDDIRLISTENR